VEYNKVRELATAIQKLDNQSTKFTI